MKFNTKASKKAKATSSKSTSTTAQSATSQNTTNANTQQGKAPVVGSISTTLAPNLDNLKLGLENVKREYERAIEQLHNYDRKLQFLLLIWTALLSVLSIVLSSVFDMSKYEYFSISFVSVIALLMILALGYIMTASLPAKFKRVSTEKIFELNNVCITQEDYVNALMAEYLECEMSVEKVLKRKYKVVRLSFIMMAIAIFFSYIYIYVGMFLLL